MIAKDINVDWNEQLPIFSSPKFLKNESSSYGWIGGFYNKRLICFIPYICYKKPFFKFARLMNETIYVDKRITVAQEKEFLNSLVFYFRKEGYDFLMQPSTNVVFQTFPEKAKKAEFGSYYLNLEQSEEFLWKGLHSKHRNVIRNAQKQGIKIIDGRPFLKEIFNLIKETFLRSEMDFMSQKKFFLQIKNLGDDVKTFVAVDQIGELQGCAVLPFSKSGAFYLHGGSIRKPLTGAMNLLHWEAIKNFKNLGVKKYDFVGARIDPLKGSKLEGIQRFKSRFGAEFNEGYLWKYPLNSKKTNFFEFVYRKTKNSAGDIIDQESYGSQIFKKN